VVVGVIEDVEQSAESVAMAMSRAGYDASFQASSLWEIERLFDQAGPKLDRALRNPNGLGNTLFALGGYVGEVLRRHLGGTWEADDDDPEAEMNVILRLADGSIVWPVQRIMKRFRDGPSESVVAYSAGLGLAAGDPPTRRARRSFLRWLSKS
jgi:hypothetical protein